jgi:hypothetical protein
MSFKTYKKGLKLIEDQAIQNSRTILGKFKYPFDWRNKGSWRDGAPRRHPGWAAYHNNKAKLPQS